MTSGVVALSSSLKVASMLAESAALSAIAGSKSPHGVGRGSFLGSVYIHAPSLIQYPASGRGPRQKASLNASIHSITTTHDGMVGTVMTCCNHRCTGKVSKIGSVALGG